MKEHLLLEKAYVYPVPKTNPDMKGYEFDNKRGFWVEEESREPFILNGDNQGPRSKKCDIETGEDQKGE